MYIECKLVLCVCLIFIIILIIIKLVGVWIDHMDEAKMHWSRLC